jgi:hypothetical protein
MKIASLISSSFLAALIAVPSPAQAKSVYLTCVTNDPAWPPPLTIIIDEDRGEVRVAGAQANGTSPNPAFTPTSVDFGFGLRRWHINRVNLSLKTDDFFEAWNGVCKFGAPPKRAF